MITIILSLLGFALGMYVSSQIMEGIESRTRTKKFMSNMEEFDKRKNN